MYIIVLIIEDFIYNILKGYIIFGIVFFMYSLIFSFDILGIVVIIDCFMLFGGLGIMCLLNVFFCWIFSVLIFDKIRYKFRVIGFVEDSFNVLLFCRLV